jgi:deoxyribodipyrimidine photo-lyase
MVGYTAESVVIHWFRRDFRITDNTALSAAIQSGAKVVCVYVVSSWTTHHRWTGPMRQEFLCGCLASLDGNLRAIGGSLIIRDGEPVDALLKLAAETKASAIFFNRDPDPHGIKVEQRLAARAGNLEIRGFKDACIHERDEVLTGSGTPFRVFTPFSKAWSKLEKPDPLPRPKQLRGLRVPSLDLPTLPHWNLTSEGKIIEPGEKAARERLKTFLRSGLSAYGAKRNIPAGTTTSRLSQDLRFGLLSIREVHQRCVEAAASLPPSGRSSAQTYINELIWREFYMAILWHYPEVLEWEFNTKHRGMVWPGNPSNFSRWTTGETGFPIVDAAMRQLNQTGFMHNRTRMITAMFLTKDLHLNWRMGESYFMQKLVDGEIASNNGGWQWSAGTGADAAPYFRIQNPWTQSSRFDPDGAYIKTWIPELRDVPPEKLHVSPTPGQRLVPAYPPPMLDHSVAREITLDLFKEYQSAK